jgi:hypothetical protein
VSNVDGSANIYLSVAQQFTADNVGAMNTHTLYPSIFLNAFSKDFVQQAN